MLYRKLSAFAFSTLLLGTTALPVSAEEAAEFDSTTGSLLLPTVNLNHTEVYQDVTLNLNFGDGTFSLTGAKEEHIIRIHSLLDGAQQVPPLASQGSAVGFLSINRNTGEIRGRVEISGLNTVSAAHIHLGAPGESGPPIITLSGDKQIQVIPKDTLLNTEQMRALAAGGLYFNIHTPDNPGGELRGQIHPQVMRILTAHADGSQQVPPLESIGSAAAYFKLNRATGALSGKVFIEGLDKVSMAHIHAGAPGQNGPIIVALEGDSSLMQVPAGISLNFEEIRALLSGNSYINIHTTSNPGGELRGQIQRGR